MNIKLFRHLTLLLSFGFLTFSTHGDECSELVKEILDIKDNSLSQVLKRTEAGLKKAIEEEPLPITSDITKRRSQKWEGEDGPESFEAFLSPGVKFLRTPDPNRENPFVAMRKHPGVSPLLHVDLDFKDHMTSTKVYVSRPIKEAVDENVLKGDYLIGPEHKSVIWHVHGGGTPSAVAANASSKANYYVKRGVPLLAVDQPGHGNGPAMAFLSDEEIFEWNYELMKKLIHPDVKIYVHGHSWGGMTATRMWQLSDTDKFKRIVAYQAESPGADVSLGVGGPRNKARIEREINDRITDWEDRAAPSDVEFLKNVVENRKMSPVAQEYTFMTDLFYRWKMLTPAEISARKNLNVLVGTYDGLVYVGREQKYDDYYSAIAGENYHKFTKGKTFKGNDILQGHQIFDLIDEKGDFIAYRIGLNQIADVSKQNIDVRNIEGKPEDAVSLLNKLFNHYSNNFAFKDYLKNQVEFVEVFTGKHGELIKENNRLISYLSNVQKVKKDYLSYLNEKLDNEVKKFSKNFNVRGGKKKAKQELDLDQSVERRSALEDFIEAVNTKEAEIRSSYEDPKYELQVLSFKQQVDQKIGAGHGDGIVLFHQLNEAQRTIQKKLKYIDSSSSNSRDLQDIKKSVTELYEKVGLFGEEQTLEVIEAKLKELKKSPQDIDPRKWRQSFNRAHQDLVSIDKERKKRFSDAIDAVSNDLDKPAGINRKSDAEWELSVSLTPERKQQLEQYIAQYDEFVNEKREELSKGLDRKLGEITLPLGYTSLKQVEERVEKISKALSKRLLPSESHPHYQEISSIVNSLNDLEKALSSKYPNSVSKKVDSIEKEVRAYMKEKSSKVSKLDHFLEVAKPSPRLQEVMDEYQKDLNRLISINSKYAKFQEEFYLNLYEQNRLTREEILNVPEGLKVLAKKYEEVLERANRRAIFVKEIKLEEASKGLLTSEKDPDGKRTQELVKGLLGDFTFINGKVAPGEGSLESKILALVKSLEEKESEIFSNKLKRSVLEKKYMELMAAGDNSESLYSIKKINVYELLDQNIDDLMIQLNSEEGFYLKKALRKTLNNWEDIWQKINAEDNFKKSKSYAL